MISNLAKVGELADILEGAGATWEAIPSLVNGPWTKELWEAVIPSMGYMALLRNLRNFDEAGVSDKVAAAVGAKLADLDEVRKSRQLPMRFLSAYNAAPSLRWSWSLEQALDGALENIPELGGRTLILVDTSGSMAAPFSKDGSLHRWDAATMFGLALARRCADADVVSFSNGYAGRPTSMTFPQQRGESLLRSLERWNKGGYFLNGGTDTALAVRNHLNEHDRVVILTDEQATRGDVNTVVPARTPLYTFNLAGYSHGMAPSGPNRHVLGGLTDVMFKLIPALEAGNNAGFPF